MAVRDEFRVDLMSQVSVYVQIRQQIQFAISSGRLKPGDTLPSIRELAEAVGVNANTVVKAYRDLELLGLATSRRGLGVMVSRDAAKKCREEMRASVRRNLMDAVGRCVAAGFDREDIGRWVETAIVKGVKPYQPRNG